MKNISDSEWKIMQVIWNKSPLFASEIIEALKDDTSWKPKTIHTLIQRLVVKGAIKAKKEKTYYSYYAAVSESDCVQEETNSFLKKCFDGSLNMMMVNFIKEKKLSEKEIDGLQKLLEAKKAGKRL